MAYAAAKARELGLLDGVQLPMIGKACRCCGERFREDGAAGACLERYGGVDSIDYCNPCMVGVLGGVEHGCSKEQILEWTKVHWTEPAQLG